MLILHGDNNIASRQALLDARTAGEVNHLNILDYSGSSLTLPELSSKAESSSLLGETNLLIISDFFTRRPGKEKTSILAYLKSHPTAPILIWEGKDVSSHLIGLPQNTVRKFDLPKYIFRFLDSFSLDLLKQAESSASAEQILALLARRVRDLLLSKYHLLTGPDWKTGIISNQAGHYSSEKLIELYKSLLEMDFSQKNSLVPYDLTTALELWVVNALH